MIGQTLANGADEAGIAFQLDALKSVNSGAKDRCKSLRDCRAK
jgi:hypothetical protein